MQNTILEANTVSVTQYLRFSPSEVLCTMKTFTLVAEPYDLVVDVTVISINRTSADV